MNAIQKYFKYRQSLIDQYAKGDMTKREYLQKNYEAVVYGDIGPFRNMDTVEKALFNYQYYNALAKENKTILSLIHIWQSDTSWQSMPQKSFLPQPPPMERNPSCSAPSQPRCCLLYTSPRCAFPENLPEWGCGFVEDYRGWAGYGCQRPLQRSLRRVCAGGYGRLSPLRPRSKRLPSGIFREWLQAFLK